ncbi:MAG: S-layer homology domain-containing protein [Chloroflexota bacterium]|nr:S-layer homology domain-containing protein [Chloroflexota bacterium]MDQ5867632.1 S-layer homology domain-containing protein [Chloroflexota bacterium]
MFLLLVGVAVTANVTVAAPPANGEAAASSRATAQAARVPADGEGTSAEASQADAQQVTQAAPQAPQVSVTCNINNSISNTDAWHNNLVMAGKTNASSCAGMPACPGAFFSFAESYYDVYTFTNNLNTSQCITITLTANCGSTGQNGLYSAVYNGSFVPENPCVNYIGSTGAGGVTGTRTYGVTVPANSKFVVEVETFGAGQICDSYTLSVAGDITGSSCPAQPTATRTSTSTSIPTNTSTRTSTATNTATNTPTQTATNTATRTSTATNTPPNTATRTSTPAQVASATATATATATSISQASATRTSTNTVQATATGQAGASSTVIATSTAATPTVCAIQFADVPASGAGSTFYSFVRCMACRAIISGYPCGGANEPCNAQRQPYFRPGVNVTRGQISKMVALAANLTGSTGEQRFEDVAPGSTFYDPIQQLASRGYIGGYPCGSPTEPCGAGSKPYFRPGANTTRGQLSKIVSESAQYVDAAGEQKFSDVAADSPFFVWIQRLANRSVISGYACGGPGEGCDAAGRPYFRPNENVTRGQTAKIVSNTFFPNCVTP